jgi:tRNA uridine 5-carbamoylmethylation protein Kti12
LRESWDAHRQQDIANFPSPFRMLMLGPPNSGKSTLAKNIVVHQDPPFDEVYIVHEDAGATREYDDLEPSGMLAEIPGLAFWDALPTMEEDPKTGEERPIKRLVIVDDVEYTSASKQRLKDLAILMRFASSHKNLSVIVSHQSFFDLPVIAKKVADVFVV